MIISQKQKPPNPKNRQTNIRKNLTGDGDKDKSNTHIHHFAVKHSKKKSKSANELLEDADRKTFRSNVSKKLLREERARRCRKYVEDHFRSVEGVGRRKRNQLYDLKLEEGDYEIPSNRTSSKTCLSKNGCLTKQPREEKLHFKLQHVKPEDNTLDDISDSVLIRCHPEFDLENMPKENSYKIETKLTPNKSSRLSKMSVERDEKEESSVEILFDKQSETEMICSRSNLTNSGSDCCEEVYLEKATQCSYTTACVFRMTPDNFCCQKQDVSTQTCLHLPLAVSVTTMERRLMRQIRKESIRRWLNAIEESSGLWKNTTLSPLALDCSRSSCSFLEQFPSRLSGKKRHNILVGLFLRLVDINTMPFQKLLNHHQKNSPTSKTQLNYLPHK